MFGQGPELRALTRRLGKTVDDIKAAWSKNSQEASKSAGLAFTVLLHAACRLHDSTDDMRRPCWADLRYAHALRLGSFMHLSIEAFLNGAHVARPMPELDMFMKFIKTLHGPSPMHHLVGRDAHVREHVCVLSVARQPLASLWEAHWLTFAGWKVAVPGTCAASKF